MAYPDYTHTLQETLLTINGLNVSYGDTVVLRDVNAEIRNIVRPPPTTQGQVLALLGPSGVGKSTLFMAMAGLLKPTSGSILVGEKQVSASPGEMGVVFQHYELFQHYTVLENLCVASKDPNAKARAMEFLTMFELQDKGGCYPDALSGGQRQRVAIAQQLMCSGEFLLMDEPFSGLDPIMKDRTCETILKVSLLSETKTIVVVTHDIGAALTVADTIWIMGRDRNPDGSIIPGARIKYTHDLMARGLAWRTDVALTREYADLMVEIRRQFPTL
jgi:polar amino acid transport system ATP-binding protein/sulfate transport system ATP-binding protein